MVNYYHRMKLVMSSVPWNYSDTICKRTKTYTALQLHFIGFLFEFNENGCSYKIRIETSRERYSKIKTETCTHRRTRKLMTKLLYIKPQIPFMSSYAKHINNYGKQGYVQKHPKTYYSKIVFIHIWYLNVLCYKT